MKASGSWGPVSLVYPQPESPQDSLHSEDSSICASVCAERRLDGLHRLEGRLLANSNTSGHSQVSQFCRFGSRFSIQSSLFQSLYGSAVFHMGHGSGLSHSASPEYSHVQIPGRLVKPASSSFSGSPSSGDGRPSLSGSRCRHHLGEVQSPSIAASGLSGGVTLGPTLFRASPSQPRVEKLCLITEAFLSCSTQPVSLWRRILGVPSSLTPLFPGGRLWIRSLQLRLHRLWDQKDDSTLIPLPYS